jgi:hypothetical protein
MIKPWSKNRIGGIKKKKARGGFGPPLAKTTGRYKRVPQLQSTSTAWFAKTNHPTIQLETRIDHVGLTHS